MTALEQKMETFGNRLLKKKKHLGKWARRQGITCYRVYDNDIPGTPLAIDIYENAVHIAEYARDHGMEPAEHVSWLMACVDVVSVVLEVPAAQVFVKYRQRQKGLQQYERFAQADVEMEVQEGGLRFIINPSDYLDTGLFLDHRTTRSMVRAASEGKNVLNLFAYTGSFSVYAAAGGAASTLTLDMSNTYQTWTQRNMTLNGFGGPEHEYGQVDVMSWLEESARETFDLVVLDPPTFSNSKRMDSVLEIQRDHVWMLNRVLKRVTSGGEVFFSTNFRKFELETADIEAADIIDITSKTIPEDFKNTRIHQCFRIKK